MKLKRRGGKTWNWLKIRDYFLEKEDLINHPLPKAKCS